MLDSTQSEALSDEEYITMLAASICSSEVMNFHCITESFWTSFYCSHFISDNALYIFVGNPFCSHIKAEYGAFCYILVNPLIHAASMNENIRGSADPIIDMHAKVNCAALPGE